MVCVYDHFDWPFRDVMGEKDLAGIAVDASPAPNIPLQVVRYKLYSFFYQKQIG